MIRAAIVWLLLCVIPAAAEQLPALYSVSGVAADDVLNIRAQPNAGAPILDSLDPETRDIEVVQFSANGRWGLVNITERAGWIAMAYLARQPQPAFADHPLTCFGTEPFWTLKIRDDDTVRLSQLGAADVAGKVDQRLSSQSLRTEAAVLLSFFSAGTGTALISQSQCNDGMSDNAFGLRISLLRTDASGPRLLSGCCSLAP